MMICNELDSDLDILRQNMLQVQWRVVRVPVPSLAFLPTNFQGYSPDSPDLHSCPCS